MALGVQVGVENVAGFGHHVACHDAATYLTAQMFYAIRRPPHPTCVTECLPLELTVLFAGAAASHAAIITDGPRAPGAVQGVRTRAPARSSNSVPSPRPNFEIKILEFAVVTAGRRSHRVADFRSS